MGLPGSPCSPTCRSGVRARYEQRGASGRTRPRFVLVSGMSRLMEQLESTSPARRDERWRPSPARRRPVELERLGFLGFWFWFSFPPPFFSLLFVFFFSHFRYFSPAVAVAALAGAAPAVGGRGGGRGRGGGGSAPSSSSSSPSPSPGQLAIALLLYVGVLAAVVHVFLMQPFEQDGELKRFMF